MQLMHTAAKIYYQRVCHSHESEPTRSSVSGSIHRFRHSCIPLQKRFNVPSLGVSWEFFNSFVCGRIHSHVSRLMQLMHSTAKVLMYYQTYNELECSAATNVWSTPIYPIYKYPLRCYPLKWLPNSRAKGKTVSIKQGGKEKDYIRKKEKEKDGA